MDNILVVDNVSKIYGFGNNKFKALKNISFTVNKGEFIGIMGPSGSGKTTLLNIISSVDSITDGSVLLNNININRLNDKEISKLRQEELGFIFQETSLLESLTIKENIILPLTFKNEKVEIMESKVEDLTKKLGIYDVLSNYPYEISGGQKQRAEACRAIITNPSLILADEPTGSLDSNSCKIFLSNLQNLNKEYKITIIMVTHDPLAASYADRILFIKDGRIFTEIVKGENKEEFYFKITDMIAMLGGIKNEIC